MRTLSYEGVVVKIDVNKFSKQIFEVSFKMKEFLVFDLINLLMIFTNAAAGTGAEIILGNV